MTREEAIKILTEIQTQHKKYIGQIECNNALNMAIEALSAEAETKCIARIEVDTEEIVRRIKEEYDITDSWISCSERLPEEFNVLCCDNHGEMLIANPFECDNSDTGFSAESDECYMYNCIAWMPLPMPYKESEKNHGG